MSTDLREQLRRYGERFETVLTTLETEAKTMTVTTQERTTQAPTPQRRRLAWMIAFVAFIATTFAVGGVVLLMQGSQETAMGESGTFTVYGPAEGLPNGCMWRLAAEPAGTWAGGDCGLYRLDGGTWQPVADVPDFVTDLAAGPDGSVWMTHSAAGASRFDGTQIVTYDIALEHIAVTDDGTAWARAAFGPELLRFDGQRWRPAPESGPVGEIVVGTDGTLWATVADDAPGVGTAGTLRYLSPDGWVTTSPAKEEFGDLVPAPGGVAYLVDGGMYRFDGTDWSFEVIPAIPSFAEMDVDLVADEEEGPIDTWEINDSIVTAEGDVWMVSTIYGALEYADGRWTHYSVADGLATDALFYVDQAPDGSIWFGSEHEGLTRRWP